MAGPERGIIIRDRTVRVGHWHITRSIFLLVGLSVLVTALAGPFIQRLVEPKLAEASHLLKPQTDD